MCGTVWTRRDQSEEEVTPTNFVIRGNSNTVTRGAPIRHRAGLGPRRSFSSSNPTSFPLRESMPEPMSSDVLLSSVAINFSGELDTALYNVELHKLAQVLPVERMSCQPMSQ